MAQTQTTYPPIQWSRSRLITGSLVAVAATGGAVLVRMALELWAPLEGSPFLLFALPVVLAAWVGGLLPGLIATVLSMIAVWLLFPATSFTLWSPDATGALPLLLFLLQGAIISWLGESRVRSLARFQEVHESLEHQVEQRTDALMQSNRLLYEEVAQRQQAAEELQQLNTRLEVSNRELQDFASVASHDLQEPLRKIQAFGDRLKVRFGHQLDADGQDYLRRMLNAAERMQTLISDLLSFSRVTTRAQPFQPVNLKRIAEEVVSDLEARIEQEQGQVHIDDLPVIDADPLQMRQLLQNLISNALKFRRPDAQPSIRVSTEANGSVGSDHIRLLVQDNGIGFDEKYLDRIFNVFQRLHGRGVYEGTGIGLAVCRKIVERHSGVITARSRPGEGTTFILELPRHQQEGAAPDAAAADQADHHPVGR